MRSAGLQAEGGVHRAGALVLLPLDALVGMAARYQRTEVDEAEAEELSTEFQMNIAIVGSRDFPKLDLVTEFVNMLPSDSVIVSGGARGVDRTAETAARARGLQCIIHKPDWDRDGRRAGLARNGLIVRDCEDGALVAFWDGKSRGTQDSIRKATVFERKLMIVREKDTLETLEALYDMVFG